MTIVSQFSLMGKTALVTGCRRGLGRAMATALAEAGADIIGVSTHLEAHGSEVDNDVTALGRRFAAYACDFADRAAPVHNLIEVIVSRAENRSPARIGVKTVELLEAAYRSAARGGFPIRIGTATHRPSGESQ